MGLQFVPDKRAALSEIRRVLDAAGRAWITLPGPKPPLFAVMTDGLARHFGPEAASFADLVFSMHEADEISRLVRGAGFGEVEVTASTKTLRLPAPADFLWQYIHSTPLAQAAAQASNRTREALEEEICSRWQEFVRDGSMLLEVRMTIAAAAK